MYHSHIGDAIIIIARKRLYQWGQGMRKSHKDEL